MPENGNAKVQAHLIRIPPAGHPPTEQRCPAFIIPQKLSIPEPQPLYPSPLTARAQKISKNHSLLQEK